MRDSQEEWLEFSVLPLDCKQQRVSVDDLKIGDRVTSRRVSGYRGEQALTRHVRLVARKSKLTNTVGNVLRR